MINLYVFTSTGNNLMVANELKKYDESINILSIPKLMKSGSWSIEGEKVGFIFPCYYGTIPQLVTRFIEDAISIHGDYFFSIITAGRESGYSAKHLDQLLKQRKYKLHYSKTLTYASNYMNGWYYDFIYPKEDVLKERYIKNDQLIKDTYKDISQKFEYREKNRASGYFLPKLLSPNRYSRDTRPWDSEFKVTDACVHCGLCEKVCPVDNISNSNSEIMFSHNCQRCMACVQVCPKSAFTIENKPMNKKKYINSRIKVNDLIDFNN